MEILRFSELVDVPWKNGGGITRNIALATFEDTTAWRLSRADVGQDGAFSSFAGLERILTVVSNTGMELLHADGVLDADPWHPLRFGGGLDITSRLKDGPLTDLNLMFDPTLCEGTVTTVQGPSKKVIQPPQAGITAFHVLAGHPELGEVSLGIGDTAFPDTATTLNLAKGDAVLEITIHYKDHSNDIRFAIAAR